MQSNRSQLYSIVIVFFFWGFIASSNGIFIPFCKSHFELSQFRSQLIDFTFYIGYFVGSLLLFLYSYITKKDFLNHFGLKKGITYGLCLSAIGALCIIPSVNIGSYTCILGSFFIVALGFSLQQTASQPYVVALGSPDTGAHRLNLAGGINSLGTTLGPIIISIVLFGSIENSASEASLGSIRTLYLIVAATFIAIALFFTFSSLPDVKNQEKIENGFGALKYPQLVLGMIAIFMYVGVEVTIQSNMGALLKLAEFGGYDEAHISPFISLYWGSLMIGRWTAAVNVFNLSRIRQHALSILVPFIAFAVILVVNQLHGHDVSSLYVYVVPILLMILVNFLSQGKQAKALLLFSVFGIVAMLTGVCATGPLALYALISGGLACSVLWPCIFSLSINGLGKYTSQGSAFLIMMIVGGAFIPPLQGLMADAPGIGIHLSYVITIGCFAYLAFFAVRVQGILNKQGLTDVLDQPLAH